MFSFFKYLPHPNNVVVMRFSLYLLAAMALIVLLCFSDESDAAAARRRVARRYNNGLRRATLSKAKLAMARRKAVAIARLRKRKQQLRRAGRARAFMAKRRKAAMAAKLYKNRMAKARRFLNRKNKLRARTARRRMLRNRRRFNTRRGRQEDPVPMEEVEMPGLLDSLVVDELIPLDSNEIASDDDLLALESEMEMIDEMLEEAMEDPDKREAVDSNGDGVPDWCNPVKPMGAWLNFKNMRLWCADKGWTNFGPYGGVPSRDNGAPAEDGAVGDGGLTDEVPQEIPEYEAAYDEAGGDEDAA